MAREEGNRFTRILESRKGIVPGAKQFLSGTLLVSQSLSISGTAAGIALTAYYGYSRGSLPQYSNPNFRSKIDTEIQNAIGDLRGQPADIEPVLKPAVLPNSSKAWYALQPAELALKGELPGLRKKITGVENEIFYPIYGQSFKPQITALEGVEVSVRDLGKTLEARSFVAHTNDRDTGRMILLGSVALGAAAFNGGYYMRRGKGKRRMR